MRTSRCTAAGERKKNQESPHTPSRHSLRESSRGAATPSLASPIEQDPVMTHSMAIFEIMLSVWLGENSYGRRELGVSGGLRRCDLERAAIAAPPR